MTTIPSGGSVSTISLVDDIRQVRSDNVELGVTMEPGAVRDGQTSERAYTRIG